MWRRTIKVALMVAALTFTLAACGSTTTGGGGSPTPTATARPACTTWRIIPGSATQLASSRLTGISALSPANAWAVGESVAGNGNTLAASLIERWDGSAWSAVANPGAGILNSVAAVSVQDAWAVGVKYSPVSSLQWLMVEHWNGAQWSIVSAPIPGQTNSAFNGVAVQSANSVWAAGYYNGLGFSPQPLIERWDGSAWRVATTSLPEGATAASLDALGAVPASNQVWAVGSVRYGVPSDGGRGYFQPLIERWDGSAWRFVASPTLPAGALAGEVKGVVALSTTNAWAVGEYTASDHTIRTLITHWNGASWTVSPSPDEWGSLSGVAATGARDVRAVGYHQTGAEGSAQIGVVERWNGATWSLAESPTPQGVTHSSLDAITADGAGGYWAAGYYPNADSVAQALIARCS
jgi:hypothetical protein